MAVFRTIQNYLVSHARWLGGFLFLLASVIVLQEVKRVYDQPVGHSTAQNCEIMFVSADPSPGSRNYERILIADTVTGDLRKLTNEPGDIPEWSPDGEQIVFVSQGWPYNLNVINRDGTDLKSLAEHVDWHDRLAWSPDGEYIAYTSDSTSEEDRMSKLYMVSQTEALIVQLSDSPGYHSDPAWSPDGKHIAFVVSTDYASAIHIINISNREQRILIDRGHQSGFVWSPDGRQIAFATRTKDRVDIHLVDVDSGDEQVLVAGDGNNILLEWSPDSSRLSFVSIQENGESQIYLIDADGSNLQLLVDLDSLRIFSPVWSPDGSHIAFIANTPKGDEVWVANVDSGNLRNLGYDAFLQQVRWSPKCGVDDLVF